MCRTMVALSSCFLSEYRFCVYYEIAKTLTFTSTLIPIQCHFHPHPTYTHPNVSSWQASPSVPLPPSSTCSFLPLLSFLDVLIANSICCRGGRTDETKGRRVAWMPHRHTVFSTPVKTHPLETFSPFFEFPVSPRFLRKNFGTMEHHLDHNFDGKQVP
jgi:hypothetical protein